MIPLKKTFFSGRVLPMILILGFTLVFSQIGCKSGKKQNEESLQPKEPVMTADDSKANFLVRVSEGGGITGLEQGYTLFPDGKIEHWQQLPGKQDTVLWTAKTDPAETQKFQLNLENSGFLQKSFQKVGNITVRIVYERPDTTFQWSWSKGGITPTEFGKWYKEVKEYCQSQQK